MDKIKIMVTVFIAGLLIGGSLGWVHAVRVHDLNVAITQQACGVDNSHQ